MPISKTPNGLGGKDFVDYGDVETLRHLQDTFSRYSEITYIGNKKKEQTDEKRRKIC